MRLNVSAWSIRRPIPAVVAFAVLTILGLVSFRTMSITRFPNIDIPIVRVLITQSGAAPSELESQVTKKVEDAVSSINGVWHIVSMVTDGSSSTIVQFTVGSVDIDRADGELHDGRGRSVGDHRNDVPDAVDARNCVLDLFRYLRFEFRRRRAGLSDEHPHDRNVDVGKARDRHRAEADEPENRQHRERHHCRDGRRMDQAETLSRMGNRLLAACVGQIEGVPLPLWGNAGMGRAPNS